MDLFLLLPLIHIHTPHLYKIPHATPEKKSNSFEQSSFPMRTCTLTNLIYSQGILPLFYDFLCVCVYIGDRSIWLMTQQQSNKCLFILLFCLWHFCPVCFIVVKHIDHFCTFICIHISISILVFISFISIQFYKKKNLFYLNQSGAMVLYINNGMDCVKREWSGLI